MAKSIFDNSTILITGGTGSWGQELTKQLLRDHNPKEIRIYSRNELKQVEMKRAFNNPKLRFMIGDVRDLKRLNTACRGADYLFHTAALKHVTVCEENPDETIKTNIIGTQNAIEAAITNGVKKFIDVSTDKAVDPLNLYGVTKACGERLAIAANNETDKTVFVCVRGGNVMGSNGSVIPLFRKQIELTNVLTITDKRMNRFIFSLPDAIKLLLKAAVDSVGGEVFVMKMPASSIVNLAEVMKEELGDAKTKIEFIGIRPGEKIDEVLVSRHEVLDRVVDAGEFFVILPFLEIKRTIEHYKNVPRVKMDEFNSSNTKMLNKKEIKELLEKNGFLDKSFKYESLLSKLTKDQLERITKKEKYLI